MQLCPSTAHAMALPAQQSWLRRLKTKALITSHSRGQAQCQFLSPPHICWASPHCRGYLTYLETQSRSAWLAFLTPRSVKAEYFQNQDGQSWRSNTDSPIGPQLRDHALYHIFILLTYEGRMPLAQPIRDLLRPQIFPAMMTALEGSVGNFYWPSFKRPCSMSLSDSSSSSRMLGRCPLHSPLGISGGSKPYHMAGRSPRHQLSSMTVPSVHGIKYSNAGWPCSHHPILSVSENFAAALLQNDCHCWASAPCAAHQGPLETPKPYHIGWKAP